MINTLRALVVIFMLGFLWVAFQRERVRRELARVKSTFDKAVKKNEAYHTLLDYLLGRFSLNVVDPFISRPGFTEKRCFHCFWPIDAGHDPNCPWLVVKPAVEALFQPSERPTTAQLPVPATEPQYVDVLPRVAQEERIALGPTPSEFFGRKKKPLTRRKKTA
jgi:hypothetical protein